MTPEAEIKTEKIPNDRSIIAVSDLHFGGKEDPETATRFCRFLDRIAQGFAQGSVSSTLPGETDSLKPLLPPAKIILLGDILELWDTRDRDRNIAMLDAAGPMLRMQTLPCDVVYVTGNHDEDFSEILTSYNECRKKQCSALVWDQFLEPFPPHPSCVNPIESLKIRWSDKQMLEISPRHYPSDRIESDILGIRSGGVHYAFLHGHQFDREQITYSLSEALGIRVDIVDFCEDLANVSVTKKMALVSHICNTFLALILLALFISPYHLPERMWIGTWTGIVLAALFLCCSALFIIWKKDLPSSPTLGKIFFIAFLITALVVGGLGIFAPSWLGAFFMIPFLGSWYIFAVMSAPTLFSYCKKTLYNEFSRTKQMSSEKIFKDGLFQCNKYNYNAEVLVFGHTHVMDYYWNKNAGGKNNEPVLMINTGTWVSVQPGKEVDSFVYIDHSGISLMQWQDKKNEIICTKFYPAQKIIAQKESDT
jgi:UDP-2,3-diacylglucosamine pyrophosphatase LpxH